MYTINGEHYMRASSKTRRGWAKVTIWTGELDPEHASIKDLVEVAEIVSVISDGGQRLHPSDVTDPMEYLIGDAKATAANLKFLAKIGRSSLVQRLAPGSF